MFAEVAKRHTRWFQVPVTARLCGFKSHPLHQKLVAGRDFVLCTTMLCLATHTVWLAPVSPVSEVKFSLDCISHRFHQMTRSVFLFTSSQNYDIIKFMETNKKLFHVSKTPNIKEIEPRIKQIQVD